MVLEMRNVLQSKFKNFFQECVIEDLSYDSRSWLHMGARLSIVADGKQQFQSHFVRENLCVSIKILLKFIYQDSGDSRSAWIWVIAWH